MLRVAASKYSRRGFKTALCFSLICIIGLLTACAAPLAMLSSSGTAVASSAGTAAVANPGTAVSLASTAATGKSPLEHAASAATKKECSFFNVIDSKPICIEVFLPTVTDKSEPLLGPADTNSSAAK
ncbi:hypothetical protein ICN19_09545 [Polynucleobacter sp. AP-Capit-er-40B-B4]|uniref:hypothetical protein n=1 Tax=Polynucleobacter sp. AP-Capit-er-40B-B4 TaxID=2576927 RepID=UPI001C0BB1A7|nr:hypothetical protein [Polynucleobacter sp. AP-Capit-er-40B-B4]MBU3582250.1 hypothetical protein [Polynucleobacter sp. AP-Capit-er-40B-B4]